LKLFTPCILAVNNFFSFQLNEHITSNTHIYHQLPPTRFGVCYAIFRVTIAVLAPKPHVFCIVAVKRLIYPVVFNLQCCFKV